jgi:arsenate reductase
VTPVCLYGYRGCSTSRAALAWLEARAIHPVVRDLVADPLAADELAVLVRRAGGLEALLSTRSPAFRARGGRGAAVDWFQEMLQEPRLIRRPLLAVGDALVVGFDAAAWTQALQAVGR